MAPGIFLSNYSELNTLNHLLPPPPPSMNIVMLSMQTPHMAPREPNCNLHGWNVKISSIDV